MGNKNTMNPAPTMTPFEQKLLESITKIALRRLPGLLDMINDTNLSRNTIIALPLCYTATRNYLVFFDFYLHKFTQFKVTLFDPTRSNSLDSKPNAVYFTFDVPPEFNLSITPKPPPYAP